MKMVTIPHGTLLPEKLIIEQNADIWHFISLNQPSVGQTVLGHLTRSI
jgi:hypothetical protein